MVDPRAALPGRDTPLTITGVHTVLGTSFVPPYDPRFAVAHFALGCFWGAERVFWTIPGVYSTGVGYTAGFTPNPTYEEVCSGRTGHTETVLVVFDPTSISYDALVRRFFESHDPTQGMRQGNDIGTQYRSGVYFFDEAQHSTIEAVRAVYQEQLDAAGYGAITTEIAPAGPLYFAEEYHQQYLAKNPNGYCGLGGTGVTCPVGLGEPR